MEHVGGDVGGYKSHVYDVTGIIQLSNMCSVALEFSSSVVSLNAILKVSVWRTKIPSQKW